MNCPKCQGTQTRKNGHYIRESDHKRVQRYHCRNCKSGFSEQTTSPFRFQNKSYLNQSIFLILTSGVSQRGCARILGIHRKTVDNRIELFGKIARSTLNSFWEFRPAPKDVQFDEAESSIHSKCKPVTIPIAVEKKTRYIIALDVGNIRGKGHLASIARKKYPYHKSEKRAVLNRFFREISQRLPEDVNLESDKSSFYKPLVGRYFPHSSYKQHKGRKPCTVGLGELKAGGYDPLFWLNHTIASLRDGLKRMIRKTWCTSKIKERLLDMLYMCAMRHNLEIAQKKYKKTGNSDFLHFGKRLLSAPLF